MGANRHLIVAAAILVGGLVAVPTSAEAAHRPLFVPGAERQVVSALADLTTAGTVASGHTDPADWAGLSVPGTVNPAGVERTSANAVRPITRKP